MDAVSVRDDENHMRSKPLEKLPEIYRDDLMIQESSYSAILASLKKKVHVLDSIDISYAKIADYKP